MTEEKRLRHGTVGEEARLAFVTLAAWVRRAAQAVRRNIGRLLLGLLYAVILWAMVGKAAALGGYYAAWSLRFDTPITTPMVDAARQYAIDNPDKGIWPTFWRQGTAKMKTELREGEYTTIWYSGQGALVWPARFTSGAFPGATDMGGCAVSTQLAWRLWGSHDVVGKSVTLGEKIYTVQGVFEDDEALCLAQTEEVPGGLGWQAAEIENSPDVRRADVEAFAQLSGLGQAGTILHSAELQGLGTLALAVPVLVLVVPWVFRRIMAFYRRRPKVAKWMGLGLLAVAVVLTPVWLEWIPTELIPAKWSDFSHWQLVWQNFGDKITGCLALAPAYRDVLGQQTLLGLLGLCFAGSMAGLWLAARPGKWREGARMGER